MDEHTKKEEVSRITKYMIGQVKGEAKNPKALKYNLDERPFLIKEEQERYVGTEKERTDYQVIDEKLQIGVKTFTVNANPSTLFRMLEKNKSKFLTPENMIFFLKGNAIGDLIAKNYFVYGVNIEGDRMDEIQRERWVDYEKQYGNVRVKVSGRVDILDHRRVDENISGKIIEVKSENHSKGWRHKGAEYVRQVVFYKMCLMSKDYEKYKDYQCSILYFFDNPSISQADDITANLQEFVIPKELEIKVIQLLKENYNWMLRWWERVYNIDKQEMKE